MQTQHKKRWKLARASTGEFNIANAGAVEKLFTVATTPESSEYFRDRFVAQVKGLGLLEKFKDVIAEINRFVDVIKTMSSTDSRYWSGETKDRVMTQFRAYQHNLSEAAAAELMKNLAGKINIEFSFAMDEESNLLQGASYMNEQEEMNELEEETNNQIKTIYADWLTKNHMLCEDGVIYLSDADGNKTKRVNPETYRQQFLSKTDGFASFMKGKTKLDINVNDMSTEISTTHVTSQT